jgi:hypothetical protein
MSILRQEKFPHIRPIAPVRWAKSRPPRGARPMGIMERGRGKGEENVSERDHQAKEEALRRLSEPEGDRELDTALERMRVEHPTFGRCSTGCTSRTTPTPQSLRSGEARRRAARRRSGPPTTIRP